MTISDSSVTRPNNGINVGDVLFILFRHKWKIMACSILGFIAAGAIRLAIKPQYVSTAKLLVRYVLENRTIDPNTADHQIRTPDSRGENIMNSELEILTSWDLARATAESVGSENIVGRVDGRTNKIAAAAYIISNLKTEVPRHSDIIQVSFQHRNPAVAQVVLSNLISHYLEKHVEIHRALGTFDFLQKQADQLKGELVETEQELRKEKSRAGIVSVEDSKQLISAQLLELTKDLYQAQAELAEREAGLKEIGTLVKGSAAKSAIGTNETLAVRADARDDKTRKKFEDRISTLKEKEMQLLTQFKPESVPVKEIQQQIAQAENFQVDYSVAPLSNNTNFVRVESGVKSISDSGPDTLVEKARVAALQAKVGVLTNEVAQVRQRAEKLDAIEDTLAQLQRRKDLLAGNYRYFAASVEQARLDDALTAGKISNIGIVQTPSVPMLDEKQRKKAMMIAMVSGSLAGLALAFLLELFLDQTLKRSTEFEKKLQLPIFLAIPDMNGRGKLELPWNENKSGSVPKNGRVIIDHRLNPYFEALRDRLTLSIGLQQTKPIVVGITGCEAGSGVSTIASGLAMTLSHESARQVLLVRTERGGFETIHFHQGEIKDDTVEVSDCKPACTTNSEYAQVNGHWNGKASVNGVCRLPEVSRVKTYLELLNSLRSKDYEYIVFDLPPTNPTSITMRLAGYMDKVLLITQAEKSKRQDVMQSHLILRQVNADVVTVFNKRRYYGPAWFHLS